MSVAGNADYSSSWTARLRRNADDRVALRSANPGERKRHSPSRLAAGSEGVSFDPTQRASKHSSADTRVFYCRQPMKSGYGHSRHLSPASVELTCRQGWLIVLSHQFSILSYSEYILGTAASVCHPSCHSVCGEPRAKPKARPSHGKIAD